ncbi:aminotransferase class I/II-fold pyridoxal phosphate-dependent enzyme [Acetobacterium fimetarium]|uniref:Aminotransferase class I/II-fold pyridoxal phosphate-dependent enzyme n=1 Tax=Acetobacterium fimetarium TaxID=52691 RepID=A0ABR6WXG7_9FIRM|nr:aminotransferase class I/II-fold pyridoxal phosphate-dependent enzyme [Acetobacterium fimetarium]MBC3805138.1 aminotransferase class I/II-fold pyridoxal phosphate-dependent enzyme [Acetobacterium fimetarium]
MKKAEMVIQTSLRKGGTDPIFKIAGQANIQIKKCGPEAVINSTIGALMDDNGELVTFKAVYDTLKALPNALIANYAGLAGQPDYLEKVVEACFRDCKPEGHIRAVATPGGTGAVRHAFCNYTELGDTILITDWHWAAYETIADDNHRKIATFPLYNEAGTFNLAGYKKSVLELLEKQKRVLTVLNTPAHNPTGYTISDDEWKEIKSFITETAQAQPNSKIILLIDLAYIDFAGEGDDARQFMKMITGMPHNVLPLYAFSCSKSYTMYGLRNGAIICVAPTEEIATEFANSCTYSNRGNWSNGTRGAMETITKIYSNEELFNQAMAEQSFYKAILRKRAAAFVEEADKIGLKMVTYRDGFFISLPCDHPKEISDLLMEKNTFVVPLGKGLRFAPCAVSEEKCRRAPQLILQAMKEVGDC